MSISDEIRASAGAHRDLGPAYDTAVAEGLVERIGEEIDKRINARLYGYPPVQPVQPVQQQPPMAPPPVPRPAPPANRVGAGAVILAFGSMALGIGATGAVLHPGGGYHADPSAPLIALIWIVIGVINVVYARRR